MGRTRAGAATLCLLLAGCSIYNSSQTGADGRSYVAVSGVQAAHNHNALVRFVNRLPGQPAMNVMYGGTTVFTDIAPLALVTPFQQVAAEQRDFLLVPAGQHEALVTFNATLTPGLHYTLIAHAQADGSPALTLVQDLLEPPAEGKARVRVINVAPGLGAVKLCLGQEQRPVTGDTGFESDSGWRDVAPAASEGEIVAGKTVMRIPKLVWIEDHCYTYIVFAGGVSSFDDRVSGD